MALLDTGSRVSIVTEDFAKSHDLPLRPLSELTPSHPSYQIVVNGVAGLTAAPLGYVHVYLEGLDGVDGYHDWEFAFVMKDESPYAKKVPLIIGTACLDKVIKVVKESEETELSHSLDQVKYVMDMTEDRTSMALNVEDPFTVTNRMMDVRDLDEVVTLKSDCTIPPGEMVKTRNPTR